MADTSRACFAFRPIALALVALGLLASVAGPPYLSTSAWAAPKAQRMAGTWDLSWRSRRGAARTGSMVVEQRGAELVAHVYDRGGATATGTLSGSSFTLRGTRRALPFTVTGRVQGRKMTGTLTALGTERHFTGTRRGRR